VSVFFVGGVSVCETVRAVVFVVLVCVWGSRSAAQLIKQQEI
jgi:hypothetical protein